MLRRLRATSLLLVVAVATLAQPALADAGVGYDLILSGYSRPIQVTSAHDPDALYIAQQGGKIERARFKAGSSMKLEPPLARHHRSRDCSGRVRRTGIARRDLPSAIPAQRAVLCRVHTQGSQQR